MKRIYYDALFTGLVPVGTPTPAERQNTWTAEVLETTGAYKKGDWVVLSAVGRGSVLCSGQVGEMK